VGPHFDQYDVFLVQGLGKRRWQLGQTCDRSTELLPHDNLRLLANFEPTDEWILEPGDILYVPPRVAHDGVAVGDDCMTYSIGFRAPSRRELIENWSESLAAELKDEDRYADPALAAQENPGEISAEAIARLHAMAAEKVLDRDAFARWFGGYNTAPKSPEIDWSPHEPINLEGARRLLDQRIPLLRNPASRCSFIRQPAGAVLLFVDGECFYCTGETASFAESLCGQASVVVAPASLASSTMELVLKLLNSGSVAFDQVSPERPEAGS
jgi:50S ribosomal protein L16 3-hydroxylase